MAETCKEASIDASKVIVISCYRWMSQMGYETYEHVDDISDLVSVIAR